MTALKTVSALIVEAIPGMRTQLRNMLGMFGITDIHHTGSAGVAVRKLRERPFDLILCEYNLGDGQDGQHLLEDLRHHNLIPRSTMFIMVTGERSYERVVSAAELAPDDYVLKPFAADALQERLVRALLRREAFLPAYLMMENGSLQDAIAYCLESVQTHPQYQMDFLRLAAELHLLIGNGEQARAIYDKVQQARAVPWARLGLAKAHFMDKQYAQAESVLEALVKESDLYLDAYDWLARTREAAGRLADARTTLQSAVLKAPHGLRRLRRLGEMSIELGDMAHAHDALAEVVRKGKYSDFRDPEDHVRLLTAQLGLGDTEKAISTIVDMERSMSGMQQSPICSALSRALYHTQTGDSAKAMEALQRAVGEKEGRARLSNSLKGELAKVCFAHKQDHHGREMILEVMRNAPDEQSMEKAKALLHEAGHGHLGDELAEHIKREVQELVAAGASKAKAGDYDGAVALMCEAADRSPNNVQVLLNAALALLRHVENRGWNSEYAARARQHIDRARSFDPGNRRIKPLTTLYDDILKKYGINTTASLV